MQTGQRPGARFAQFKLVLLGQLPMRRLLSSVMYAATDLNYRRVGGRKGILCFRPVVWTYTMLIVLFQSSLVLRFVKVR